jgi:hypothetical protein
VLRSASLFALAAIAWALELLDGATAMWMMQTQGVSAELNPAIRSVYQAAGPLSVVVLKFILASVVIAAFMYLGYHRRSRLAHFCLCIAIAVAGVGVASNLG